MKKSLTVIIILIVVLVGGLYIYKQQAQAPVEYAGQAQAPTAMESVSSTPTEAVPSTGTDARPSNGADYTPPQSEGGGETPGSDIQVYEVDYDGKTFTPQSINIKVGDYIFFKNTGEGAFWPVSTDADHSSLNAGKVLAHGAQYKFQFTSAGSWNYKDSLNTMAVGKIVVQ